MPDPLGVDTSLETAGGLGMEGVDAPDFEAGIPVPSFDEFQETLQGAATKPGGFSQLISDEGPLSSGDGDLRSQVVKFGKQFVGTPYVWGGTRPGGFDCSGLLQYVTKKFGLNLPRVSYQQANAGKRISIGKARAGDLVAWDNSSRNNGADHIAMYLGNGYILEAPRAGLNVRVRKLSASEMRSGWGVALTYPGEGSGRRSRQSPGAGLRRPV